MKLLKMYISHLKRRKEEIFFRQVQFTEAELGLSLWLLNLLLLIHFVSPEDGEAAPSAGGSSQGSAVAVLVKALRTRNAKMGDKSNPPRGGMNPRNMFKYGSHKVLKQW